MARAEAALREAATSASAEAVLRAEQQAASTEREAVAAAEAAAERALAAAGCEHGPIRKAADMEALSSKADEDRSGVQICCQTRMPGQNSCSMEHSCAAAAALAASAARSAGARAARLARCTSRAVVRRARTTAIAATRAGALEARVVSDSATAKAAAAEAAWRAEWAGADEARAEEAEAVLKEGVVLVERALMAALGKEPPSASVRVAAGRAVGRACSALLPDFFAPLWAAREEGRGPEALGPLEIPCVFCFDGFDWAGPPARLPVLTPCCRRRLCAGCADQYATRAARGGGGGGGGGGCLYAHRGCAGPTESSAWRCCAPDEELSLRWKLARALGFEFPAD